MEWPWQKVKRLEEQVAQMQRLNAELKAENERLRRLLEEAQRASKRQAAPFSRRNPKAHPQKPGRKAGSKYGRPSRRPIPEVIDQTLEAALPRVVAAEGRFERRAWNGSIRRRFRRPESNELPFGLR